MANVASTTQLFKINEFRKYQLECLGALSDGFDCFVCQPTGNGKSIIFQSFPFYTYEHEILAHEKQSEATPFTLLDCPYKSLVVLPLQSLMEDQETFLKSLGIKVVTLHHKEVKDDEALSEKDLDECHIIFVSPEAILTNYRHLLKSSTFSRNLKLIAIDESHCIRKWGSASDPAHVFRQYYGRLSEIRSLVPRRVPVVALTATATLETKSFIIENLSLFGAKQFVNTPERKNITYRIQKLRSRDPDCFLDPIIEIMEERKCVDKVLIFCRTFKDVRLLYGYFCDAFPSQYTNYQNRPFAMFHSKTNNDVKKFVLREFMKEDGVVKVVIATIAFGMGIDCKGLYKVIHFGPPETLEDYFQESGRIGRDGLQSEALMLVYPRCLSSKNISSSMKAYVNNSEICRRSLLLKSFDTSFTPLSIKHFCCDICQTECKCSGESSCTFMSTIKVIMKGHDIEHKCDVLNDDQKDILVNKLSLIREKYINKEGHCGRGINYGFPLSALKEIVNIASSDISVSSLKKNTSLFNSDCYEEIVTTVQSFCLSCDYDESSSDSSDGDVDKYHANLSLSSDDDEF